MKYLDQFDEIDHRILRALQRDASLSHAALAEEVGASPASCWRRIKALEGAGVLGPAVRLVNAAKVGRGVSVMCQLRMKTHATKDRQEFEAFIQTRGEIMDCHSMSGEWDYLLRVVVADVASYERFLMRELLAHPAVAAAASHFALSQVKYTTALPI
ncbi:Lrp/AsnC family transcriptional regulator [Nitrospirillum iridis]|uniref:Lrp/AsnC family transcriptional regulator n=1 Tax=Nitrospirillum iridis TaxID=765888 RepID=A0A7X0AZL4_9PROT|nr:Lrp/AsnC family transcriptional regulator [Nitrospirillum iridis]MBB6251950.1 Lrp/AsnC family transcriptional regulator [Nitrospirillum iridis]